MSVFLNHSFSTNSSHQLGANFWNFQNSQILFYAPCPPKNHTPHRPHNAQRLPSTTFKAHHPARESIIRIPYIRTKQKYRAPYMVRDTSNPQKKIHTSPYKHERPRRIQRGELERNQKTKQEQNKYRRTGNSSTHAAPYKVSQHDELAATSNRGTSAQAQETALRHPMGHCKDNPETVAYFARGILEHTIGNTDLQKHNIREEKRH